MLPPPSASRYSKRATSSLVVNSLPNSLHALANSAKVKYPLSSLSYRLKTCRTYTRSSVCPAISLSCKAPSLFVATLDNVIDKIPHVIRAAPQIYPPMLLSDNCIAPATIYNNPRPQTRVNIFIQVLIHRRMNPQHACWNSSTHPKNTNTPAYPVMIILNGWIVMTSPNISNTSYTSETAHVKKQTIFSADGPSITCRLIRSICARTSAASPSSELESISHQ
mmetsp:Transcript_19573/g.32186  ORF Transcript_19573/g.32186 Transcript_19573/m.32186 type:complete len:222 (+) Transcript_19573:119-784(+)